MSKEIRYLNEEIILRTEDNKRTVEGYAATFNNLSQVLGYSFRFREKINRNAFEKSDMNDVVALFNHNENFVLARTISNTLELLIDDKGLKYRFEAPNNTAGNDLIESLKRRDIQHSSFAFSIEDEEWEKNGDENIRTILKIEKLYDVSPVVSPAYLQTDVSVAQRKFEEQFKIQPNYNNAKRKIFIMKHKYNIL